MVEVKRCYGLLESYLENRMNQLVLQVTQKCNLRCSYCVYSGDYKIEIIVKKK